jgi:hypothetical protein
MAVTAQSSLRELETEVQASLLDLHKQAWKTRGHAKQQWLDRALAEPAKNSDDVDKRASWIKRALDVVKSGREEIKYQAALLDAYAEHLSVLEMSLMAASESKNGAETKHSGAVKQGAEGKQSAEAKRGNGGSEVAKRPRE